MSVGGVTDDQRVLKERSTKDDSSAKDIMRLQSIDNGIPAPVIDASPAKKGFEIGQGKGNSFPATVRQKYGASLSAPTRVL